MAIVGVDTGGTFTDFIFMEESGVGVYKTLSTPDNPSRAVIQGLGHIFGSPLPPSGITVVHGSTVATNAILERKGVPTALFTGAGFEDVIEIGRQNRSRLYDLAFRREPAMVPPELRFGIPGRLDERGTEIEPLDLDAARRAVARAVELGAESAAVCLLFSFHNPDHENAVAGICRAAGLPVSLSHQILAEFREYERTSTTVVNAYVSPRMNRYLADLDQALAGNILRVMQSNGGSISVATGMAEPVRTILSGPAGGAVGAFELGRAAGFDRLITFDMGGTSTDVALMDRHLPLALATEVSGVPVKVPMIDIHTVGAGGGSIARIDPGGALAVGPESAGADPGPICYGKGSELTVTDANLYLGRLIPDRFLGGRMALETGGVRRAMEALAKNAGLDPVDLALGIVSVVESNMERAIRVISVERGHDPREFCLLSFGGAGGLHAAGLARLLGVGRVLIPRNPGILSAVGMVLADVIKDFSLTIMRPEPEVDPAGLDELFGPLEARALDDMAAEGFTPAKVAFERSLDMRYKGQSFEIVTGVDDRPADLAEAFARLHEQRYGYRNDGREVEVVNLRLRARGAGPKPEFPPLPRARHGVESALVDTRPVWFDSSPAPTPVYDRESLAPGHALPGPAIVTEMSSTIVIPPFARAEVDGLGNLLLHVDD